MTVAYPERHAVDPVAFLEKYWGYMVGGASAGVGVIKLIVSSKERKQLREEKLIELAQKIMTDTMGHLKTRVDELEAEIKEVRGMLATQTGLLESKEKELVIARGEIKSLQSQLQSYQNLLDKHNIPYLKSAPMMILVDSTVESWDIQE